MTSYRRILLGNNGRVLLPRVKWCDSFACKLRGFTWRRVLAADDGLVLVERADSRMTTSIHMLFVFFDLGVIWVNDAGTVVDKTVARPWRPSYVPQAPARYVIEGHPNLLSQVEVGDRVLFQEIETS